MSADYAGKHVFVAGASSGINLEIAHSFARAGAKVTVLSRSAEKIEAAAAGIRDTGAEAIGISCDVRDYEGLEKAYAEATGKFGPIDVLVSGAAGNFLAPAVKLSANAFKTVVDIDLLGTFNVFRASYDHLTKPGASLIANCARPLFPSQDTCAAGTATPASALHQSSKASVKVRGTRAGRVSVTASPNCSARS